MKTLLRFLSLVGCVMIFASLAGRMFAVGADDTAKAMQALDEAVRKSAAEQKAAGKVPAHRYFGGNEADESFVPNLQELLLHRDTRQIDQLLNGISADYDSVAVRNACNELRTKLRLQRAANQEEITRQTRSMLDRVSTIIKSSIKPADLDPVLQEFAVLLRPLISQSNDEVIRQQVAKIQSTQRLAISWQNYLSQRQYGNVSEAIQSLQSLVDQVPPEVMARSELLAWIEQLKAQQKQPGADGLDKIFARIRTLDDLIPALLSLHALQAKIPSDYAERESLSNALPTLELYSGVYNEYLAGLPTRLDDQYTNVNYRNALPGALLNVKAQLLRLIYARELNVEDRLKPGANEPITAYINRVWNDARERCDARLMLRLQKLTDSTTYQLYLSQYSAFGPRTNSEPFDALRALLSAQNQDEAGQFVPAVISYQAALKQGGEAVSARAIGARLDAIKAAHQRDYDRGMEIFLSQSGR